jgi:hypothetical protein
VSDFVDENKPTEKEKPKPKPGEKQAELVKRANAEAGTNLLKFTPHPSTPRLSRRNYREVLYCEEVADEICRRRHGGETMVSICEDETMPALCSIWEWERKHPEFKQRLDEAKRESSHYIADDCMRIADDLTIDPLHKRIMVDTRLRLIKCWNRQAYGDNVQVSGDQNNPVRFFIDGLSDRDMK